MGACIIACSQGNQVKQGPQRKQMVRAIQSQIEKEIPKEKNKEEQRICQDEIVINIPEAKNLAKSWKTQSRSRFYKEKCPHTQDQSNLQKISIANQPPSCIISDLLERTSKKYHKFQLTKQQWLDETHQNSLKEDQYKKQFTLEGENQFIMLKKDKYLELSSIGLTEKDEKLIQATAKIDTITKIQQKIQFINLSVYEGQWKNGKRHGQGKIRWKDGTIYQGQWRQNKLYGFGKLTYTDKQSYCGQFINNRAEGEGEYYYRNGFKYTGDWKNNLPEGNGTLLYTKDQWYEGSWKQGKKNGYGQLFFDDGSYYKGDFFNNQIHGYGQYQYGHKKYDGNWEHNEKCGNGVLTWKDGSKYEGNFYRDKMHGKGKYLLQNGILFQGEWVNGRRQGLFLEYHPNGQIIKSEWHYNKLRKQDNKKSLKNNQPQLT